MKAPHAPAGVRYSVRATSTRLGICPHTLRAWEARYGAVDPDRSKKGQRFYTALEVERLENIVKLVNRGHSVGVVARLGDKEPAPSLAPPESGWRSFRRHFRFAITAIRRGFKAFRHAIDYESVGPKNAPL